MPLFVLFVDLQKAYDCVDRTLLFSALVHELGVAPGVVAALRRMYTEVSARALVADQLSDDFPICQGVL